MNIAQRVGGGVEVGCNSGTLGPNLVILDVFKSTEHDNVTDNMINVHIVDLYLPKGADSVQVSLRTENAQIQEFLKSLKHKRLFHHWQVAHNTRDGQKGEKTSIWFLFIITGGVRRGKGGGSDISTKFHFFDEFPRFFYDRLFV